MIFVDTNYFVRIIENDNKTQVEEIKKLFLKGADRKVDLVSSTVVLFEIYWLMKSYYGKKKDGLVSVLRDVLDMSFIRWENNKTLTEAVETMKKTNYDLEDAYNLVYAKGIGAHDLASFDNKLQKVWGKGD
jgi:predicted nucleic-acid-binding protein